jgi:bifunctional non-homologous end joining protein LigD
MRWDGVRALGAVEGGRLVLTGEDGEEITASFPELRELAEALAPTECLLDGEVVAFSSGQLDPDLLKRRSGETDAARARRLADRLPVTYLVSDLLYVDGSLLLDDGYADRRTRLDALEIAGDRWQVPPYFPGKGTAARKTSRDQGLPGVVAKRLKSVYGPGKRTKDWLIVAN